MVYGMLNGVRRAQLTAMITKEVESAAPEHIPFEEYLVDTVIRLSNEMGDDMQRRRYVEVVKSRGQAHSHGRHALEITPQGIFIYPPHEPKEEDLDDGGCALSTVSTGVCGLDAMLCGGLPEGFSALVAGSAGVGKTTLVLQFLNAGAQKGEPGLLITFEESPRKLQRLAAGFGIDIADLQKRNLLSVMHRSPLRITLERLLYDIREEMRRIGARRVALDSLTDLSMTTRDPIRIREAVYLLTDLMTADGASALFTSEVPELFGQTQISSEHISIIVDGIILMKYLEMESEIQRAISVLKMRGCDHDKDIRRYIIDDSGIVVCNRFEGTEGVLAGSPRRFPVTLSVRSFSEVDQKLNTELLARFSAFHPHVQPVSQDLPYNPDEAYETIRMAVAAPRTRLSVVPLCMYWTREIVRSGRLLSLDDTFSHHEREIHMDDLVAPCLHDDTLYAIPAIALCGVLIYRKDLLEQYGYTDPPATWDELVEQARTIVAGENDPALIGCQFPAYRYEGLTTSFLQNLWSNGGEVWQDGEVLVNSDAALQALGFMRELIHEHKLAPATITGATGGMEPQVDFLQGRTVFLIMLPTVAQVAMRPDAPLCGRVGIAPVPHGPGADSSTTFLGAWHYGIPTGAEAPDAARQFIRYMTGYEVQRERALRGGPLPTIRELYNDPEVLVHNPHYPLVGWLLDSARRRSDIPRYLEVSRLLQKHLHPVLARNTDPRQALDAAAEEIRNLLAENG